MCPRGRLAQGVCLMFTAVLSTCVTVLYFTMHERATWAYFPVRGLAAAPTKLIVPDVTRNVTEQLGAVSHHRQQPPSKVTPPPAPVEMGCMDLKNMDKDNVLVLGHRRKEKGFLTIGIPHTAQTAGQHRLRETLDSLIQNMPAVTDRSRVTIVVFTCALNPSFRRAARDVVSGFPEHVQSGLLHLVEAPRTYYPPEIAASAAVLALPGGPGSFPHPAHVKQCIEGAFLLTYASDISQYYLQLSDDVRAAPNFTNSVRDYIQQREKVKDYWVTLEFSPAGGATGKLIRGGGRDVHQLVHLLVEFNQYKTFDDIYKYFTSLNVQRQVFSFKPPLFYPW